jgi:4-alpha-glucanotransferase
MLSKPKNSPIPFLGRCLGISGQYWDNFGRRHRTSLATYRALLAAMGVPWEDPEALTRELERRRLQPFDRLLSPVHLVSIGSRKRKIAVFPLSPPTGLQSSIEIQAKLSPENGSNFAWETVAAPEPQADCRGSKTFGFRTRLELPLPLSLKLGYYDLTLRVKGAGQDEVGTARIIVAPHLPYFPPCLEDGRHLWGINLPLYALKSEHNWGLGDFRDLEEAISWAAGLGASFVGINPIHAPSPAPEADPSPYSPTSRQFLNFFYVNLAEVPELQESLETRTWIASPEFTALKARLQASELVDYPEVYRLKRRLLSPLYQAFLQVHCPPEAPRTPRGEEFDRFLAEKGESLAQFAQFCAMEEYFQQPDWRRWPSEYQNPQSPAVAEFTRSHLQECGLHKYAQWLAAKQLAQVCRHSQARGLPFTLYQDLALGAAAGGFDTWAYPDLFAHGASMGAPPESFHPKGQSWGLPPFIPERLRESGYRPFVNILRASLPADGMLRLDHVMGLFRLFWIPPGLDAARGTYVRYPARELLAVLALESVKNRTLIIGEDLGTVAPYIRRELSRRGVFSSRVFYFERTGDHQFKAPEEYPRNAMASVTTHDLPTLAGYWQGEDIKLKSVLGLYPQTHLAAEETAGRNRERERLLEALGLAGIDFGGGGPGIAQAGKPVPPAPSPATPNIEFEGQGEAEASINSCPEEVRFGVLEYLARSKAVLLEVRLEEIFGVPQQQNLPGTTTQYPNWRRKFPLTLKEMRQQPAAARLAARLRKYRGGGG